MLLKLKNKDFLLVLIMTLSSACLFAQKITYYNLPGGLDEISGLEIIKDSLLVGMNDGGNDEEIYLFNFQGVVQKKVKIENAKNKDWEDIATDGKYIYIADIGNNNNKRKHLQIYKISIEEVLKKDEVKAKEISFSYKEQKLFPPSSDSLYYDAEGLTYYNDSLWLFTKNRSTSTDGYSWIYKIPTTPGEYEIEHTDSVFIGKRGWLADGITAVDVYKNTFYLLTYTRLLAKKYENGVFVDDVEFEFDNLAQRESVVVKSDRTIYMADEKNPLVGEVILYRFVRQ
jgi:hypothetical protein